MNIEISEPILFTRTDLNPELEDLGCGIQLADLQFSGSNLSFKLALSTRIPADLALAFADPNQATLILFEHAKSSQTWTLFLEDPHFTLFPIRTPNFIPPETINPNRHVTAYAHLVLDLSPLPVEGGEILMTVFLLDFYSPTLSIDLDQQTWQELEV